MAYKCSFCGAEYQAAIDRARCEFACDEKQKMQAEQAKKKKLSEERRARYEEAIQASENANKLWNAYEKDYGNRLPDSDLDWYVRNEFPFFFYGRR